MSQTNVDYRDSDRQVWCEELDEFVPARIFDAHIHLFRRADFATLSPRVKNRSDADLVTLNDWARTLYPNRKMGYLILGMPLPGIDVARHVTFVKSQIKGHSNVRYNRLVTPSCKLEDIDRDLQTPGIIGLKPYRLFATSGDVNECRIEEFLTHEQMAYANDRGLWVTMHLSRFHGCADKHNLDDLEEYTTKRYPNIKWILAHCARSFTYWPIRNAIERLRDMPNIHYDTSAVTDVRPYITLLTMENPKRIFFGTDGVSAAFFHGQYVALGRAWQHYDADAGDLKFAHCDGRPILSVYEQLLSMKHAAEIAELSRDDVEGIFWNNAATALGLEE